MTEMWRCNTCGNTRQLELHDSLEYYKKWIKGFLLAHPPMECPERIWENWVDWNMDSIGHAIDHIIADHCPDWEEEAHTQKASADE